MVSPQVINMMTTGIVAKICSLPIPASTISFVDSRGLLLHDLTMTGERASRGYGAMSKRDGTCVCVVLGKYGGVCGL
jgi:hypothetical protein